MTESEKGWAYRHRRQAETKAPLDERTSKRFAGEFEMALRARGAAAKLEANRGRDR